MQLYLKKFIPHLIVIGLFAVTALIYFSPVLQGKKILQSDIVQYSGMAKQLKDYRETTGEETYWTDAAFGGMPTYQLGAKYPHNYIKKLDLALRFLPRPADYLFLYFIGMYILLLVLKIDYKLAFLGAIAFGFSTYLIIILGVGHNAKAHAIAYMPLVISGVILTFRGKYFWGFLLTTIAMALELVANHFQMTYYLLFIVICIGIAYFIDAYKKQFLVQYAKAILVMTFGVIAALGMNASNLMATKEYADTSTRGKSQLTIKPDGSEKELSNGLDYDYITEYSYGIIESFNLFIPRFMGGGSNDALPSDSKTFDELLKLGASPQEANEILTQLPAYWGDQPIVAAPAYVGAIVIFLAVLALFLVHGRLKWWIAAAFVSSLALSWGKNFSFLTELFIDYVPLYDKFRAVSSIQVIIELILPVLAVIGLQKWFSSTTTADNKQKALIQSVGIVGGITLVFIFFKSSLFDFSSMYDQMIREQLGTTIVDAVREDRMRLLTEDSIRSLVFVLLAAGTLWVFLKTKIKEITAVVCLTILIVLDLGIVDKRYVNNEDFVSARVLEQPFQINGADAQILEDEGHFRVYDVLNRGNPARASYFHNSIGGYHAAKPRRFQEIDDFYISRGDIGILNMMNVRYIITKNKNGGPYAQRNPYANGNAWFVENALIAETANEEIKLLDSLNSKKTAVINREYTSLIPTKNIVRDSTASIVLIDHKPQHLVYESKTNSQQLAIFSEVYYSKGWNAYINGKSAEYFRADYLLRAMVIPEGINKIEFKFEPDVIEVGSKISLGSSVVFLLIFIGGLYYKLRKKPAVTKTNLE